MPPSLDGRCGSLPPRSGRAADMEWTMNALGRTPPGRGAPDKRVRSWDDLLDRMDVQSGQTISFHHHLRDGDAVVNEVVARLAARAVRGPPLAPPLFSLPQ